MSCRWWFAALRRFTAQRVPNRDGHDFWRPARFALATWLLATALLARRSHAQTRSELNLELFGDPPDWPQYACLLTKYESTDPVRLPSAAISGSAASGDRNPDDVRKALVSELERIDATDAAENDSHQGYPLRQALRLLSGRKAGASTGGDRCSLGICDPHLQLPRADTATTLHMTCAENSHPVANGKVLVVRLDFAKVERKITHMELSGTVLRISLAGVPMETERGRSNLTATVVGGDYAAGSTHLETGSRVGLPLLARCSERDVNLPEVAVGEKTPRSVQLRLYLDDETPIEMRRPWDRRLRVPFPNTTSGVTKRFEAQVSSEKLDERTCEASGWQTAPTAPPRERPEPGSPQNAISATVMATFESRWTESFPPQLIAMRTTSLSFSWAISCLLPLPAEGAQCPEASLPEVGHDCKGTLDSKTKTCSYRCPASPATEARLFDLPTPVLFSVGAQKDAWRESIHYVNQRLSGYADRDDRQFAVDFSRWHHEYPDLTKASQRIGDRIDHVEIASPSGLLYRFKVEDGGQRITVPGATCGDLLRYRYVGDRLYSEGTVRLENGQLSVPPPDENAKVLRAGFGIGGGGATPPLGEDDIHFNARLHGILVVTAQLRPTLRWGLPRRLQTLEVSVGYIGGPQPYRRVMLPHPTSDSGIENVAYSRFMAGTAAFMAITDMMQLGAGLSVGIGYPLFSQEERRVDVFSPFGAFELTGRFGLTRDTSVDLGVRLLGPERFYIFNWDYRGSPVREGRSVWSLMFDVMFRYWL